MWQDRINCYSLIKRESLMQVGGFDERFCGRYGFEDEMLLWKLTNFPGAKIKRVPFAARMYRGDKGRDSQDQNIRADIAKNQELFEKIIRSASHSSTIQK